MESRQIGQSIYRRTARNFNPMAATAGKITVVEVEEIVENGTFDPDQVHTPGIFIDRIITQRASRKADRAAHITYRIIRGNRMVWNKDQMAERAAQELQDGFYVNLGIGLPTLVANYVGSDKEVGSSPKTDCSVLARFPQKSKSMPTSSTPANKPSPLPGSSIFSSADSFGMIRGGHVDLSIFGRDASLGERRFANWMIQGAGQGMGGAMDLVAGVKRVIILMEHTARKKDGSVKNSKFCQMHPATDRCACG